MINLQNPKEIESAFKLADNKVRWSLAKTVADEFKAQIKLIAGLRAELTIAQGVTTTSTSVDASIEDMTDEEISAELRLFFISRLKAKTLIPAEINAFKEILGLLDKEQSIIIQTVNYANVTDEDIERAKVG